MKRLVIIFLSSLLTNVALAQWQGSNPVYFNAGNVGIGTNTPGSKLEIIGDGSNAFPLLLKNNNTSVLGIYASTPSSTAHSGVFSYRSRGTITSPTDLFSGDRIAGFYSLGYFGGGYRASAAMEFYAGTSPSSSSYPTYIRFGTTPTGGISRLERLRISENGNIGIGVSNPAELLHLNGSIRGNQSGALRINSGTGYVDVGSMNSSWVHFQTDRPGYYFNKSLTVDSGLIGSYDEDLSLQTAGVSRFNISNSTGNIGINTTPHGTYRLDVNGPINATALYVNGAPFSGGGGGVQSIFEITPGNGNGIRFWSSDAFKIHMGGAPEYLYGPVFDFSIKSNMSNEAGRGWTWGISGSTPVAALNNTGQMKIAGAFEAVGPVTGSGPTIRASGGGDVVLNSGGSVFFEGNYSHGSGNYIRPIAANTQAFFTAGAERMRIASNGNVGIGTALATNPNNYKLAVNGLIGAKEVKVENTSTAWPDYVFASDYKLKPLDELELYIQVNKHLPEIPSATEIAEKGHALGEMNSLLLKKVEELTLYIIDLKKEVDALKNEKK